MPLVKEQKRAKATSNSEALIDRFISRILPGNYSITKSMELTKVSTSGTLWYTKKFIVLYYYCFLTDEIFTNEYIKKVQLLFDDYIESVPRKSKENAYNFFYPKNDVINFKSQNFKSFNSFIINDAHWENGVDREKYLMKARKYYFTLLMNVGGQTGVKRHIKNSLFDKNFIFSEEHLIAAIEKAALQSLCDNLNENNLVSDNSIKHILPETTIKKASNYPVLKKLWWVTWQLIGVVILSLIINRLLMILLLLLEMKGKFYIIMAFFILVHLELTIWNLVV